jgi:hypothetical protein
MKSLLAALTRELAILLRAWGDTQSDHLFATVLTEQQQDYSVPHVQPEPSDA